LEKTYSFCNNIYKLKPITLEVLNAAVKLIAAYRKNYFENTANIDTSELTLLENEIQQINNAIKQEKINPEGKNNPNNLIKLKQMLAQKQNQLQAPKFIALKKLIAESDAVALLDTITNYDLIIPLIPKIIESTNGSKINPTAEQLNSAEGFNFIKNIIADFFLITLNSLNK
jgi:hypothetical protein